MLKAALAALVLAACSTSAAAPLLEDRIGHTLQLDAAACHPAAAASAPVYDGDFWTFPASATPLRCGLPIEAQDYVTSWLVYGRHGNGSVATTACLQLLEMPQGEAHYDVGPCGVPVDLGGPGALTLSGALTAPGLGVSEDFAISLVIHGAPGDRIGGASVEVLRLH